MGEGESPPKSLPGPYGGGPRAKGRGPGQGCLPEDMILNGVGRWGWELCPFVPVIVG